MTERAIRYVVRAGVSLWHRSYREAELLITSSYNIFTNYKYIYERIYITYFSLSLKCLVKGNTFILWTLLHLSWYK